MPQITYNYNVGDIVYFVDDGIKSGEVLRVDIEVTSSGTTIEYVLRVDSNSQTVEQSELYENCKAESGYQNAVFTAGLTTSTVVIPVGSPLAGSTLTGTVTVDGIPLSLSYPIGTGSPVAVATNITVQDILTNLNAALSPYADAAIYNNTIRITSRSTGTTSTVVIEDGTGSPLSDKYFANLTGFTGLASSVAGKSSGALEALGNSVC